MNKDAFLASIIGFSVGLVITGAILVGPKIMAMIDAKRGAAKTDSQAQATNPTPIPQDTTGAPFVVDSPQPEAIVSAAKILVSGKAPAQSMTIVSTSTGDEVVQVKDDGAFAANAQLLEGTNDIQVTSYVNGKGETKRIRVYYSEESL